MPPPIKPQAVFYGPSSGLPGDLLAFQGTASNQVTYLWDFGDGNKSQLQFPAHRYAKEGTYVVSLIVSVNGTPSDPLRKSITVFSAFSVSTDSTLSGSVGNAISFTAVVSGGVVPLTYLWNFGDSTTSNSLNTTHTYSTQGTYNALLTVTDASNNVITKPVTATIGKVSQTISYTTPSSPLEEGDSVTLAATATSGLTVAFSIDPASTGTGNIVGSQLTVTGAGNVIVDYNQAGNSTYAAAPQVQQSITVTDTPVTGEPLMYLDNLTYVGAFRLPNVASNGQYFSYSGTSLCYNPTNNSLFMVGGGQYIAEMSIPTPVNSNTITNLNTSSFIQPLTNVLSRVPSNPGGASQIGGCMIYNGKLIFTAYIYYDNSHYTLSHSVLNSLNLSSAAVTGLFRVGNLDGGLVAGNLALIPSEWQADLTYPCLTGLSNVPIISRSSSGPDAFAFDPAALGPTAAPFLPLVYYTIDTELGPYESSPTEPPDPLQSSLSQNPSMIFPPGTSSILYIGNTCTGFTGYGIYTDWNDSPSGKGPMSLNSEYDFCVWAYDVHDFIDVKNGTKQPTEVTPYIHWTFQIPIVGRSNKTYQIGGAAYDSTNRLLYVSVKNSDNVAAFSSLPLIFVYRLDTTQKTPPIRVGSLMGYPVITPGGALDTPQAVGTYKGSIHRGDTLRLVAGSVYFPTIGVKSVSFFLDDVLLGTGTPSTIPFAEHNYIYTFSTGGVSIGVHTIKVVATGNDDTTSTPLNWTLTVIA